MSKTILSAPIPGPVKLEPPLGSYPSPSRTGCCAVARNSTSSRKFCACCSPVHIGCVPGTFLSPESPNSFARARSFLRHISFRVTPKKICDDLLVELVGHLGAIVDTSSCPHAPVRDQELAYLPFDRPFPQIIAFCSTVLRRRPRWLPLFPATLYTPAYLLRAEQQKPSPPPPRVHLVPSACESSMPFFKRGPTSFNGKEWDCSLSRTRRGSTAADAIKERNYILANTVHP